MSFDFYLFTSFYFIYVCSDSWVSLDLYVSIKTTTTTTTNYMLAPGSCTRHNQTVNIYKSTLVVLNGLLTKVLIRNADSAAQGLPWDMTHGCRTALISVICAARRGGIQPHLSIKFFFPGMGIPVFRIRQSPEHFNYHLIFMMGILILVRRRLYIETVRWSKWIMYMNNWRIWMMTKMNDGENE